MSATEDFVNHEGAKKVWYAMADAPLDGTLVRLLVKFDSHAIEDTNEPAATIGSHNDGEWNFVGWCWHTDEWTRGSGDLLGWLPMQDYAAMANHPAPDLGARILALHPAASVESYREPLKSGYLMGWHAALRASVELVAAGEVGK